MIGSGFGSGLGSGAGIIKCFVSLRFVIFLS